MRWVGELRGATMQVEWVDLTWETGGSDRQEGGRAAAS